MCKDGFYFFSNYRDIAKDLPEDLRVKFYDALMDYAIDGIEPEEGVIKALITAIKPSLEKVEKRGGYREGAGRKCNQNKSNEIKNNQKESKIIKVNQTKSNENQTEQKETKKNSPLIIPQEENNKNIYTPITPNGVIASKGLDTQKRFVKPTLEELKGYFAEKGFGDESERFFDFYSSKGWMVGKNPMKDWRAAVRNWVRDKQPQQILKPKQTIEEKNRESLVEFLRMSGELQ